MIYAIKNGFKNLGANKLFTIGSIATIACSVFVFCIFFLLIINTHKVIEKIETTIGIQVFFDENLAEEDIVRIAEENFRTKDVYSMRFISSEEAWEKVKTEYFNDREDVALAFKDDNPLANSASYEIFLYNVTKQKDYVNYIKEINGVRQVNYSSVLIDALTTINIGISTFSIILIVILCIVSIIIISNTILVASEFKKRENEIMKLIGATNFMIRAPFVFEGLFIGLFGSIIPLVVIRLSYDKLISSVAEHAGYLINILTLVTLDEIFMPLCVTSIVFSVFSCCIISFFTIRKHLHV